MPLGVDVSTCIRRHTHAHAHTHACTNTHAHYIRHIFAHILSVWFSHYFPHVVFLPYLFLPLFHAHGSLLLALLYSQQGEVSVVTSPPAVAVTLDIWEVLYFKARDQGHLASPLLQTPLTHWMLNITHNHLGSQA